MATSGYLDKKVTDYDTLRFSWERTAVSADTNKSTIKWTLSLIAGAYGAITSSVRKSYAVVVNGTSYSGTNFVSIENNTTKALASGTTVITHNADGTKTFSFSFSQDFDITFNGVAIGTIRGSGTGVIDAIGKPATLLTAPDFNEGENPTITYSNPMGTNVSKLQTCITWSGSADISYRDVPKDGTSYTYSLTAAETAKLAASIASGTTKSIQFYLRTTYANGSTYVSALRRTFTLTNGYPTVTSFTARDTDTTTLALTGNENIWIKGRSDIAYSITAQARQDATLETYDIECGDNFNTTATGTFTNASAGVLWATVVDSRDNATTASVAASRFIDYNPVTCTVRSANFVVAAAAEGVGTISFTIGGRFFNDSFGAVSNTLTLQYRYKAEGESYSSWITVTPTINGYEHSCNVVLEGEDYTKNYYIQVQAQDKLSTNTSSEYKVDKVVPIFDWSAEDFNFNVPITIEGNSLNDYVIETGTASMGTNGTWYWRKWKNGRAECYGCRNYGVMAVTTAWGGLYRSGAYTQPFPFGLFTATPEVIDISYRGGSGSGGWIANHENSAPSASETGSFILVRPASASLSSSYLSFNIIGRWK